MSPTRSTDESLQTSSNALPPKPPSWRLTTRSPRSHPEKSRPLSTHPVQRACQTRNFWRDQVHPPVLRLDQVLARVVTGPHFVRGSGLKIFELRWELVSR